MNAARCPNCHRTVSPTRACRPCSERAALQARSDIRPLPSDPRYSVSPDGVVYGTTGRPLKEQDQNGYKVVQLSNQYRFRRAFVHRLVLETFVGPCPEGMETLHGNGVRDDNRLSNLRYGTRSENVRDAVAHGTHHKVRSTSCKYGHEYLPDNVKVAIRNGRPYRVCLICDKRSRARKLQLQRIRRARARGAA